MFRFLQLILEKPHSERSLSNAVQSAGKCSLIEIFDCTEFRGVRRGDTTATASLFSIGSLY